VDKRCDVHKGCGASRQYSTPPLLPTFDAWRLVEVALMDWTRRQIEAPSSFSESGHSESECNNAIAPVYEILHQHIHNKIHDAPQGIGWDLAPGRDRTARMVLLR
jgi:hypothetical protein